MRENIILKCTECGEENYINTKNKRKTPPNDLPWTCFFDIMLNGIVYPI